MCKLDQIATKFFNEIKDLHPMEGLVVAEKLSQKIHAARDARREQLEAELKSLDKMPEKEEKQNESPNPTSDSITNFFVGASLDNAKVTMDVEGDMVAS